MSDSVKREIYKGGNDIKPGKYYYFVDTRKPVPYQTKRVDGKIVPDPEFDTKYLPQFKIVNKPDQRASQKDYKANYQNIRSQDPKVVKSVSFDDLNDLAISCGWRLSHKATRALRVWGKNPEEIKHYLLDFKKDHKDCNYLDYDPELNQFLTKYREHTHK